MPLVEFGSVQEIESVLRALVLFKFGGGDESDVYVGSPVVSSALRGLFNSVVEYYMNGDLARAEAWHRSYELRNNRRIIDFVVDYAARHPNWNSLSLSERDDWISVVAAPYLLDEDLNREIRDRLIGRMV